MIVADRVSTTGTAITYVRPSVRLFPLFLTEWLLTLTYYMCVGHDHSCHGLKVSVRVRFRVSVRNAVVGGTSILNRGQFSSCFCDSAALRVVARSRDVRWRVADVIGECKQCRLQRLYTALLRRHARPRPRRDVTPPSWRQPQPRRLQRTNVHCLIVFINSTVLVC